MPAPSETEIIEEVVDIPFEERLAEIGLWPIEASEPTILQMNLGYRCNQRCAHCHIEAGPHRTEVMSDEVIDACLNFADTVGITQFDLTGGAPELHPRFRELVPAIRDREAGVIDRCNLTILSEPGQEDLAEFLAKNTVSIVASLPHYNREATERMRGKGVFDRSLAGLKTLNALGYGQPGSDLELTLVYNPAGAILPGSQASLEADFRSKLREDFGIEFTNLIALINMPLGRFLGFLSKSGNLPRYMRRLEQSFNPATVESLMCRFTLSVGHDGVLYDCDFNQCIGIEIRNGRPTSIQDVSLDELVGRAVRCRSHCYGCTAGQGSSCGGAVAE